MMTTTRRLHEKGVSPRPNIGLGFLSRDDTLCLSVIVTSRCNLRCSYCHYYSRIPESHRNTDIQDEVFDRYLDLIDWIKSHLHQKIQVRFSGGEPLLLGGRLYELAEKVRHRLGERVHVLTNGELLSAEVIRTAANSGISAFLVSIENPFEVDKGSINPSVVMDKIAVLDGSTVEVLPAVVIVQNHMFSRLAELADLFFDKLGQVPTLSELNFNAYISPKQTELKHLRKGVEAIVAKYLGKTPLVLFPYIVPELAFCYENRYLLEFGVRPGSYDFFSPSVEKCIAEVVRYLNDAYPAASCERYRCTWHENCRRIKWAWHSKMRDYCAFKRAISDGYYAAIAATT